MKVHGLLSMLMQLGLLYQINVKEVTLTVPVRFVTYVDILPTNFWAEVVLWFVI